MNNRPTHSARTGRAARWRRTFGALACGAAALAMPALAQDRPAASADDDDILVSGRRVSESSEAIGEDRVTNTVGITREALLSAPSGISGLKMLESLPGFNVQTEGSLGLYEFGNSVQVRAFNLDQIGFLVDGIPTGRSDPFGGSPVFRYVDNENLGLVEASPGAGDVSLPSYSSLGPIVQYRSITPQDRPGVFVAQTFGESDLRRTFVPRARGESALCAATSATPSSTAPCGAAPARSTASTGKRNCSPTSDATVGCG